MTPTNIAQGERLRVATSFYEGIAGVVSTDTGGQFACRASLPRDGDPVAATIDGRPVTITYVRPSDHDARIVVARFVWGKENSQ